MAKIRSYKEGPLGWLIFDNPAKRNAINFEMWQRIPQILDQFNQDPDIRVIILKGEGREAFTAGADITEFSTLRQNSQNSKEYNAITKSAYQGIKYSPKPIVAFIQGFCIGGGLGLALQSDLRIASLDAQFGIPAVKRGIAYGYDGVRDLLDIVGAATTKEILFTGQIYDAKTALRMGLIHHLIIPQEIDVFVNNYCLEIASGAPLSIRAIKTAINEYYHDPDLRDLGQVESAMITCFDSMDYQEGIKAFLEKRKPIYSGK